MILFRLVTTVLSLLMLLAAFVVPVFGDSTATSQGQDPLPVPENWRGEAMDMPPPFAPTLTYEGKLYVKFSPTWQEFDAPEGWTYAFVWRVAATEVNSRRLEADLEAYFDGLMQAVGAQRHAGKHVPTEASLKLGTSTAPWARQWQGTVRTWDAFSTGGPLALNFEIREMSCDGDEGIALLFLVSKAAFELPVWQTLRDLVPGARC